MNTYLVLRRPEPQCDTLERTRFLTVVNTVKRLCFTCSDGLLVHDRSKSVAAAELASQLSSRLSRFIFRDSLLELALQFLSSVPLLLVLLHMEMLEELSTVLLVFNSRSALTFPVVIAPHLKHTSKPSDT